MRVVHPISLSLAAPGSGGAISIEGERVDQFRHEKSGYGDSTGARKNKSITSNSCETSSRVLCNGPLEFQAGDMFVLFFPSFQMRFSEACRILQWG